MHDQPPPERISSLPERFTNQAHPVLPFLHDDCETSWRIVGVLDLLAVPRRLIEDGRFVCLPRYHHHNDQTTVVIQSSYLTDLIQSDAQVDINHDPTRPSDAEKFVYGWNPATQKARERWLRMVVGLASSGYPFGVQQACRDHTHSKGWKEDLDERVLLQDISVSTFSDTFNLTYSISHEC